MPSKLLTLSSTVNSVTQTSITNMMTSYTTAIRNVNSTSVGLYQTITIGEIVYAAGTSTNCTFRVQNSTDAFIDIYTQFDVDLFMEVNQDAITALGTDLASAIDESSTGLDLTITATSTVNVTNDTIVNNLSTLITNEVSNITTLVVENVQTLYMEKVTVDCGDSVNSVIVFGNENLMTLISTNIATNLINVVAENLVDAGLYTGITTELVTETEGLFAISSEAIWAIAICLIVASVAGVCVLILMKKKKPDDDVTPVVANRI